MSKKKIQLVLDDDAQNTLGRLREATNAESMAHVLRDALGVYSALHDLLKEKPSMQLALIDRQAHEFRELNVPSLQGRHGLLPGTKLPMPMA